MNLDEEESLVVRRRMSLGWGEKCFCFGNENEPIMVMSAIKVMMRFLCEG